MEGKGPSDVILIAFFLEVVVVVVVVGGRVRVNKPAPAGNS